MLNKGMSSGGSMVASPPSHGWPPSSTSEKFSEDTVPSVLAQLPLGQLGHTFFLFFFFFLLNSESVNITFSFKSTLENNIVVPLPDF